MTKEYSRTEFKTATTTLTSDDLKDSTRFLFLVLHYTQRLHFTGHTWWVEFHKKTDESQMNNVKNLLNF